MKYASFMHALGQYVYDATYFYFTNVFYKSSVKSRYGISVNWLN